MNQSSFNKVRNTNHRLYGPRTILVTGYLADEQPQLLDMLAKLMLTDLPVKFISEAMADRTIGKLATASESFGKGTPSNLPRAVIMSGITENELHQIMSAYRAANLPSQLWATLTPTSETWSVSVLLEELAAEKAAFEKRSAQSDQA